MAEFSGIQDIRIETNAAHPAPSNKIRFKFVDFGAAWRGGIGERRADAASCTGSVA
ncbi:MAG: hypothetical protein AB7O49_14175 [Sphingomonadales bacterium]